MYRFFTFIVGQYRKYSVLKDTGTKACFKGIFKFYVES